MAGYHYKAPPKDSTAPLRVFGVGFKGWVELRESATEPTPYTTDASSVVKSKIYDDYTGRSRMVNKTIHLKQTVHDGGKVLGCVSSSKFYSRVGIPCSYGKVVEIPKSALKFLGL